MDARYGALMDRVFAAIGAGVPGFSTLSRSIGILVSSPRSRTHYHADLPGQALWQIRGRKRLYLYQPAEPFVSREQIERITVSRSGVHPLRELVRRSRPGGRPRAGRHGALAAQRPASRRQRGLPQRLHDDGILHAPRSGAGTSSTGPTASCASSRSSPRSSAISGPGFYAKAALQRALRDTPIMRRHDAMDARRPELPARSEPARRDRGPGVRAPSRCVSPRRSSRASTPRSTSGNAWRKRATRFPSSAGPGSRRGRAPIGRGPELDPPARHRARRCRRADCGIRSCASGAGLRPDRLRRTAASSTTTHRSSGGTCPRIATARRGSGPRCGTCCRRPTRSASSGCRGASGRGRTRWRCCPTRCRRGRWASR